MASKLYRYRAVDQQGEPVTGSMEEENAEQVTTILQERGLQVNEVEPDSSEQFTKPGQRPLNWDEISQFNEHLISVTRANLPLAPSLKAVAQDLHRGRLKTLLESLHQELDSGTSLEDAIEREGAGFPPVYRSMIRAGERIGNLPGVLAMMSKHSTRMLDMKAQLAVVFAYPALVLSICFFVVLFLLVKVVPVFAEIFSEFGAGLPAPTEFLVFMSDIAVNSTEALIAIVAAIVVVTVGGYLILKRTRGGQVILDNMLMHLPFVGRMYRLTSLARFAQSLGLMLESQSPILESLELAATSSGNAVLKKHVDQAAVQIAQGERIADALSDTGYFPHAFCWFLANGENYGDLPTTLTDISKSYEQSISNKDKVMITLLGPTIVFLLSFVIGYMVIALYLPIFTLGDAMGG